VIEEALSCSEAFIALWTRFGRHARHHAFIFIFLILFLFDLLGFLFF